MATTVDDGGGGGGGETGKLSTTERAIKSECFYGCRPVICCTYVCAEHPVICAV